MKRFPALPLLTSALGAVTAPAVAQTTDAFAGIPSVTFTYYDVDGTEPAAIRAAMNAVRPTDNHDGQRVDALSRWSMRWRWRGDGHGGCDLGTAEVTVTATVTLPRLADPEAVPPDVLGQWNRYMTALATHEAGHVRYAYEHRGDVQTAIAAATCATATAAARAALEPIKAHDIAYDRDTRHGRTQGAVFP